MLKKESLKLYVARQEDEREIWRLRSLSFTELMVDRYLMSRGHYPKEMQREMKERLLTELWYDLYGDIIHALPPLHHEVMRRLHHTEYMLGTEHPVALGFSNLMTMLKPPVHWAKEMVESPMKEPKQP